MNREMFQRFAAKCAERMGTATAFMLATIAIIVWAITGPIFNYSDSWQLYANTGTTIITFLMVFLIQSSQNRDAKALHLKLDELIRSSTARNLFADLEHATETELNELKEQFAELRTRRRESQNPPQ